MNQFAFLYVHARQRFIAPKNLGDDPESRTNALAAHADKRLKAYHEQQATRLRENQPPDTLGYSLSSLLGGQGKASIEMQVELIAAGNIPGPNAAGVGGPILQTAALASGARQGRD